MAENQEDRSTEDLLDEPSQTRIDDMREKGQVAQSREVVALITFLAAGVTLYLVAPGMGEQISAYLRDSLTVEQWSKVDLKEPGQLAKVFSSFLKIWVVLTTPVLLVGFFSGIISGFLQVGPIFTFEPIQPDFGKINPLKGFQRFFSMKFIVESIRTILKIGIAVAVGFVLIQSKLLESPSHLLKDPENTLHLMGQAAFSVLMPLVLVFGIFAGIDFWLQRREWFKQVRLTKQEAKEEAKDREGNPQIKARVRSVQRDMARKRMMDAVKKADVVITNPTHISVAIKYDRDKMMAPKVVAKGADLIAQKIREIARQSNVPLVENVPLARTLFKSVKINQTIPRALYQAVAEILAFVFKLKHRL